MTAIGREKHTVLNAQRNANKHAGKKASHQKQGDKESAFWNVPTSSGVQSVMKGSHHDADATNKNDPNHQAVSDLYQNKATPHTIAKEAQETHIAVVLPTEFMG
jgi:hypothetical protein